MKDTTKISCPCGKKLERHDWRWLVEQYGEHPYCGCAPCSTCDKFSTFDNPIELTKVVDEDGGLLGAVFYLCPECLKNE